MGYRTAYTLTLLSDTFEDIKLEIISKLRRRNDTARFTLDEKGNTCERASWYEHDEDMKEFSGLFPSILFKLHGEGEGAGDVWDTYYKNGKMQHCQAKLIIPAYDENLLK